MGATFDWLKPSPLWQANGLDVRERDFFQPRLLEFRSDSFMEDFYAAAGAPKADALQKAIAAPPANGHPRKLFQPAHGCFYLVCGSLCCRQPGFPDREVRTAEGESVFFVLRKRIGNDEYGWVPSGLTKGWQVLTDPAKTILDGEERLPLSTVVSGNGRPILFGYLPVSSRETYAVAPRELARQAGDPKVEIPDPRVEELRARFADPLTRPSVLDAAKDDAMALTLSVYLLLDLYEFFQSQLADVADALKRGDLTATFSGDQAQSKSGLMAFLRGQPLGGSLTLAGALGAVGRKQKDLNQPGGGVLSPLGFDATYNLQGRPVNTDGLLSAVQRALPAELPPIELPKFGPGADAQYVLRCVYERPQCCKPAEYTISQRCDPFQLAPFFDPDAPARPVKIPLPTDVSIAALRRAKKGVSFMISDGMRKKMASLAGHEQDLITKSPSLTEPSDGLAFICSFSIQIIFIVAFFLLIMFVVILNLVFWWMAFFKICLPIPKKLMPG